MISARLSRLGMLVSAEGQQAGAGLRRRREEAGSMLPRLSRSPGVRQVCVVAKSHQSSGVYQLARGSGQRAAAHEVVACVGMPQGVEGNRGLELRATAGIRHAADLFGPPPWQSIDAEKQPLRIPAACAELPEERGAVLAQVDVARLAALALSHLDGTGVLLYVADPKRCQLAVATARQERAVHEAAKVRLAGVQEANRLVCLKVDNLRRVNALEWLHPAPCCVGRDAAIGIGHVERRLKDGQNAVPR